MTRFRSRLQLRLLLVALVTVAPAVAAILVTQSLARQRSQEQTLADSLRLVRLAASQQASVLNGARNLLQTLAEFSPVRGIDPAACLDLLPRVLRGHSGYLALTVANNDGTIFCSTSPRDQLVFADARRRPWFERAMRTRTTAVGDYQLSAVTGTPAIVIAHPLLDADGRVSRIVVAMIDLAYLNTLMSGTTVPPGGTLTLFDHAGTILARFPDRGSWIGRRIPTTGELEQLVAGATEVTGDSVGVDGVRRLYVTVPMRASIETGLYVGMGIDRDAAFRESDRIYRWYLWLLGFVSLMGLGAAGLGSHLFVLRPLQALRKVADRIAAGDLSARAQLAGSVSGVNDLSDAVNAMAGALDTREHQREQAEDARRLLAAMVASSDEAIYGTTVDGTIVSWNAGAERLFGYPSGDIVGRPVQLLYPDDRAGELPELLARINRGEHVMHFETIRRRQDRSMVSVSLTLSPIHDAAGTVIGTSAIARDMTEPHRAEKRLRDAEERMRFALEVSHVGVWEANLKKSTGFWSTTCEAMHGLKPGTFGQTYESFLDHVHPDDRAETRHGVARAIQQRAPSEIEYRTVWPDGTVRRISLIAHFSFDDRGAPVRAAGVTIDVTERRSLEEQLRQSQKMDAIGQLAGGIAHDFNNLLTVIQGCAGFLSEALPEPDERRADVDEIQRAAERAAGLTKQLLAFSRKQILSVRVLHVGDIVGEVTPMLRRLIGETIDLRTAVGNRGLVKADPGQLQQVIVNLAVNARDAMPQGGSLTLDTSDVVLDAAFARLHPSVRPGPHVMLSVTDTGHGMDAATQKRVFEPFFTTKPLGQGTGLGLATVYGIVKQSGGTIWVESEVGRGATFKLYLPSTEDVEAAATGAIEARVPGGTESVLLIEDEDPVREFVHRVLSRRGYTVHAVANPLKALDYAEAHRLPIDLLFSDVMLPVMSGRTLVTQMQQWHPESAVLFMSGYTDHAIVHDGVLDPDTAFLQKPFTAEALARTVRDVLDAAAPRITEAIAADRSSGTAIVG